MYEELFRKGEAELAKVAGAEYANDVFAIAAQNADQSLSDEDFYEAAYNSLSGVLESRNAPDAHFNAAIQ